MKACNMKFRGGTLNLKLNPKTFKFKSLGFKVKSRLNLNPGLNLNHPSVSPPEKVQKYTILINFFRRSKLQLITFRIFLSNNWIKKKLNSNWEFKHATKINKMLISNIKQPTYVQLETISLPYASTIKNVLKELFNFTQVFISFLLFVFHKRFCKF